MTPNMIGINLTKWGCLVVFAMISISIAIEVLSKTKSEMTCSCWENGGCCDVQEEVNTTITSNNESFNNITSPNLFLECCFPEGCGKDNPEVCDCYYTIRCVDEELLKELSEA